MPAPPAARLLVVEDDDALRQGMEAVLRNAGYLVRADRDGSTLRSSLLEFRPDMALLDVRLPGDEGGGFTIAEHVRRELGVPVLFVTAADALADRLRGFEVGADDYLVKPFAMPELLARVRAILRRSGRLSSPTHEIHDVVLDEATKTVLRGGVEVNLTGTEFELLAVLARDPGRVFSKVQLLSLVWGFDEYDRNLVEVHVSALRRKLEALGPRIIHTERGAGYFIGPRLPTSDSGEAGDAGAAGEASPTGDRHSGSVK